MRSRWSPLLLQRELHEVTPRNSNEDELEYLPNEPFLSSELARDCAKAVEWEPTLTSELARDCAKAVEWEPTLTSELARDCAKAVEWEPTLASELAQECAAVVAVEASTPVLKSALGKRCELVVRAETLELKSGLAIQCAHQVGLAEAGSSSCDESEYEDDSGSEMSLDDEELAPKPQYDELPPAKYQFSTSAGMTSKPSSREATELARKRLNFV